MLSLITQAAIRLAEDDSSVTEIDINPDDVTPGVIGFVFTLLFAIAIILLGLDLYRRVRRMQYRQEVREEIEAELAGGDIRADQPLETDIDFEEAPPADAAATDASPVENAVPADDAPSSRDTDTRDTDTRDTEPRDTDPHV